MGENPAKNQKGDNTMTIIRILARDEDTKTYLIQTTRPAEPVKRYLNRRGVHCKVETSGIVTTIKVVCYKSEAYRLNEIIERI
jgi:hypothetical protein